MKTKSQTTVTIGDVNTTSYSERYPFNGYYNYSWSNMLYLNSEAGSAGQITQVSFFVTNSPSNYIMNNQIIYVRSTSTSSFTNANYPGTSGFTQVYNGTISYNGGGWKTITLNTPFSYDGTSNLEFLFENRDASWANGFPYFAYTTSTGSNRIRRDFQDASFPTSCVNCLALNSILNIQLTKQCATSTTLTSNSTSVCAGNSATLTAEGANTYTWSPSISLNSPTGSSVIATPSATTIYSVTATDASNCIQTKTLSLTVSALPTLSISPLTPSLCAGSSITLTTTGATNYTWSPSTGLNATTSSSVIANPTITTTYTVTGSNNNCVNTKTTAVTVYSVPVLNISPGSTTICNGGVVSLTASGASAYTWTPSSGLSSTNTSNVNANPSSTTIYTVTGTSDGCSSSSSSTVSVSNINAGTAVASGSGNICSNSQVTLSLDSKSAISIGTGTISTERYPFNGYYNYSWSDVIYTQSEIGEAGIISKIAFYVDNLPSNYLMNNQLIYIRNTSASSFTNSNYPGTSGFTQVFSGSITYNGSGWKEITFTTPYSYNGTDNLEFLFENRDATYATGFPTFRYSVVSSARVKRDYQDASFPGSCVNCAAFSNVPNVQFTIDRALSTFVKWQYSYDDNSYDDLIGGTSANYSTQVNTSTYFRAQSTNGSCNAFSASSLYLTNNNYYVNDNSTAGDIYTSAVGNAVNDGKSPSKPKVSINDVIATYMLTSCDTIFVDKGTYTEEVNFTSVDAGNGNGYLVIVGAGIDVSILNAPTNKHNFFINQANNIKIEKFTLNSTQSTYNNIRIQQANANIVSNNKLVHSTSSNIYMVGTSIRANRNEFLNNQINNSSTSGYGVAVVGNCDSLAIRGNTITNTGSLAGILISSTKISNDIYYPAFGAIDQNTITAQNYGVILSGPDFPIANYTVSNNSITITSSSLADGASIWLGSVGNSSAEKSLIFNNRLSGGKNGIYISSGVNFEKIYNNYISNNNYGIYVSSSTSSSGELYFNSFYNSTCNLFFVSSASAYWKIKNNILYNSNSTSSNACIRVGNAMTFVACNNNLYYTPNGASVGSFNGINYSTLTNWQAIDHADETPKGDENSVYGNPLFVNVSQNNLDVTGSSPAASAGVSITGIINDIYNTTRLNPPFIGAVEFLFSIAVCNTQTITCTTLSVTLTGTTVTSGVTYAWTGPTTGSPAGSSPSSSLTIVSSAGLYTLTVTNSNNVSLTNTVQVVANNTPPSITAGTSQTLSPSSPSVTLTGSSTTSGITYSWNPGGTTPTSNTTSVSSPGIYTLTVSDTITGCASSATVQVIVKLNAIATITDDESNLLKGSVNLTITGGIPPYNVAWNGLKLPLSSVAYHLIKDSLPGVTIDSVYFKHYIDSLRQRTVFNDLEPSTYSFTIYDQSNDSVIIVASVGTKITSWALTNGVSTSTSNINSRVVGNINYFYGSGSSIIQQGTFSHGNSFAILPSHMDLLKPNEISFMLPNENDVAYVGIFNDSLSLNGDTSRLNQKTMFRFNGNGTFDIIYKGQTLYSSSFSSGDMFALRTGSIAGKLTYYKNEGLLTQADIAPLGSSAMRYMPEIVLGNANSSVSGLKVKLPIIIQPPVTLFPICSFISFLYPLSVFAEPNPACLGSNSLIHANLTNVFKDPITIASNTYTWQPGNLVGKNQTVLVSGPQIYTVNVEYFGCVLTKTLGISVTPIPAISYVGSPFPNSINTPVNVILTNSYSVPGTFSATPSGLSINVTTGAIIPSLSSPGTYTVTYFGDKNALQCNINVNTIIVIKNDCPFKINTPIELPLCVGDLYNLSATGDNLTFSWVPSTGLSCTSCNSPILTVNAGVTSYTVYATKDGDISGPCGSQVIHISIKNDCIENTITGCCFSNFGAAVFVSSSSTFLNVYCNLVNELGQFTNGNIKKGEFINKGSINVALDWIHNAQNNLYLSNEGITDFFGLSQNMTGNSHTHFNRLDLTGNGIKTAWLNEYANSNLNLNTNEFHIQNNTFFMKNPISVATNSTVLITGTGSVAIAGGGFVSASNTGYLSRVLQTGSTYFYPMGSRAMGSTPLRYRPLQIIKNNTVSLTDEISVNFMNTAPVIISGSSPNEFYNPLYTNNINDLAPSVSLINNLYYHKIKQTVTSAAYTSSLSITSYFPSGDGSFQSLSEWEKDPSHNSEWWGSTPGASSSTIPAPAPSYSLSYVGLINALTNGMQTFNGQPFTLAQSGPYVNTGDFGGDGTVITVTSTGSSPSTTSTTTYTNGTSSSTVTSTSGGVTTSTITSPTGATTTVTISSTTSGSTTVTSTTTATGGVTSTTSNTTTTTNGVTTSTTSTSTGGSITSTTTNTTSTSPGGVTTSTTSTTPAGGPTSTTTSTASTSPGGVTTSTTSTTNGTTSSTTTNTTSTVGGVSSSTTTTTDGTTSSTTTNTTSTVGGVTSSTTTTTSGGTTSTEVCETTYGGMSSITACTLTVNGGTPTTYTSSTSTTASGGDGSAGSGLDNPLGTGTSGTGSTGLTTPNTPGDYEITITPADDCALPGKIKFTVNSDGTINSSTVMYGVVGSSNYLGRLSEDVYSIDNVNSGLILHSIPKNILKKCVNGIKIGTSTGDDFVLNKSIVSETLRVILPSTTGIVFNNFELYNSTGVLIDSTPLTQGLTNTIPVTGFPSTIPNGVYNFQFSVDITISSSTTTEIVKGQLIIK